MKKDYLPSKEFLTKIIVIVLLVAGIFSISKIVGFIKNRPHKNTEIGVKIVQSIQKDSNNNDIPDWEESLWGLNPKKDGEANKEFILNKRKALNPNGDFSDDIEPISKNEGLTREFFAVIMSLQQTGNLDENAIEAVSNAYSQKIEAELIPDIYTKEMIKITEDTPENTVQYYTDLQNLMSRYQDKDIGSELGLIVQAIAYNDPQVLSATQTIAVSYRNFGQELIKIPVTDFLFEIHLNLANNYEKNAQAIHAMTKLFDDPITAMKAIINYKRYNDLLGVNLELLSSIFETE